MATFSKVKLSGGTNGLPINVVAIATAGTLIHTADTGTDNMWLYATNSHTAAVVVTVEFGGVAAKDLIIQSIPVKPSGLVLIVPGLPLSGSVEVRVFAATADVISISGYADRIA